MDSFTIDRENLLEESRILKSGLGAVGWAVLEMMRRGGMPEDKLEQLQIDMNTYFAAPSNQEANTILRVLERRLEEDKVRDGTWYT